MTVGQLANKLAHLDQDIRIGVKGQAKDGGQTFQGVKKLSYVPERNAIVLTLEDPPEHE